MRDRSVLSVRRAGKGGRGPSEQNSLHIAARQCNAVTVPGSLDSAAAFIKPGHEYAMYTVLCAGQVQNRIEFIWKQSWKQVDWRPDICCCSPYRLGAPCPDQLYTCTALMRNVTKYVFNKIQNQPFSYDTSAVGAPQEQTCVHNSILWINLFRWRQN